MADDGITQTLSEFVAGTGYDDLPPLAVRAAKELILDSLACTIGAGSLTPARIVIQLFEEMQGIEESTVWATGSKIPCLHAAYVNAYLANLLDYDDTYSGAGHPGATVVPPALAVAERTRATGRDLLAAVVLGYEVAIRIGLGIEPSPARYRQGWGYGFQIFGAATVAGKLLGLDVDGVERAFGLAGIAAPGAKEMPDAAFSSQNALTWPKNYYGWPAMGGVLAAFEAARGFKAAKGILDGDAGFWRSAGSDRCNRELMIGGLGEKYLMVDTEHKPYPTCRWTHSSIDALDGILAGHPIDPHDIQEIRVLGFLSLTQFCSHPVPEDIVGAQFSLPYLLALRIHGRSLTPALSEEDLTNPEILHTAQQVIVEHDPAADRSFFASTDAPRDRPATVTVKTMQGETFSRTVRSGKGGAGQKLTEAELHAKFQGLVAPVVGRECATEIQTRIEHLEALPDVRLLAEGFKRNQEDAEKESEP
jgi:2-methylcitrate dehydratase PrpD